MLRGEMTLAGWAKYTKAFPKRMEKSMILGLRRGGAQLVREAKKQLQKKKINDTGMLSMSVQVHPVPTGAVVTVTAPYAANIELGTRPYNPPLLPLAEWAARKLGLDKQESIAMAYAIRERVREEGFKPKFFMRDAIQELKKSDKVLKEVKKAMDRSEKAAAKRAAAVPAKRKRKRRRR